MVERVFDYPDIPRHVRMVERTTHRSMTVAADVLYDPALFSPLEVGGSSVAG